MKTYRLKSTHEKFEAIQFTKLNLSPDGLFRTSPDGEELPLESGTSGPQIEILSEIGGFVVVNEGDWIIKIGLLGNERCSPALFSILFEDFNFP